MADGGISGPLGIDINLEHTGEGVVGPFGIDVDLKHLGQGLSGPLGIEVNSPVIKRETAEKDASAGMFGKTAKRPDNKETDLEIEALNLATKARKAAYALKKAHPSVKFTSGRRTKEDQARAMAGNVVKNRNWIKDTYVKSKLRSDLQQWVDDNPRKKTKGQIQAGLISVFNKATEVALGRFSKHLGGMAFDVQPVKIDADEIIKTIRELDGLDKFLEKEGGLVRWHVQF